MKGIKNFGIVIVIIGLCSYFTSCGVSMQKGETWLNSKTEQSDLDIAGMWLSPEWGAAKFNQDDKNVTGMLGDYPVKGVVSGSQIYLVMYSGGSVHYTAELKALDNKTLKGSYSKYTIIDDEDAVGNKYIRPMTLNRE